MATTYEGISCWGISVDGFALLIHQELGEIPLDGTENTIQFYISLKLKTILKYYHNSIRVGAYQFLSE